MRAWSGRLAAMLKYLYWTLLAGSAAYAFWRGRFDERFAAATCVAASLATAFLISPWHSRYRGVESSELLIDIVALLLFVALALRSQRFWPLWIAGLQLTTSLAHLVKATETIDFIPQAYAAAERFWSYPILIILVIGTFRARHRPGMTADYG